VYKSSEYDVVPQSFAGQLGHKVEADLRKIGIVASGSTVIDAVVILNEGEEKSVKAEDLLRFQTRTDPRSFGLPTLDELRLSSGLRQRNLRR